MMGSVLVSILCEKSVEYKAQLIFIKMFLFLLNAIVGNCIIIFSPLYLSLWYFKSFFPNVV